VVGDLLVEPRLDGIEQSLIQNGGLLAFEDFAFERDFADIEAIAQKLRQRPPGKCYASDALACPEFTDLLPVTEPPKQPRRKLSKAELRELAATAFLAWRVGQTTKGAGAVWYARRDLRKKRRTGQDGSA
jgi:hypothetical protein